jgi:hypothetical protein
MNPIRWRSIWFALILALNVNAVSALDTSARHIGSTIFSERWFCKHQLEGEIFFRTELYFGLSRANGPAITEEEFQRFIDTAVTPRFPDGLTLLSGNGQFRDSTGAIVQEGSKLLILLYSFSPEASQSIEAIREEYKKEFQQQSVLRVDEQSCVSF